MLSWFTLLTTLTSIICVAVKRGKRRNLASFNHLRPTQNWPFKGYDASECICPDVHCLWYNKVCIWRGGTRRSDKIQELILTPVVNIRLRSVWWLEPWQQLLPSDDRPRLLDEDIWTGQEMTFYSYPRTDRTTCLPSPSGQLWKTSHSFPFMSLTAELNINKSPPHRT